MSAAGREAFAGMGRGFSLVQIPWHRHRVVSPKRSGVGGQVFVAPFVDGDSTSGQKFGQLFKICSERRRSRSTLEGVRRSKLV